MFSYVEDTEPFKKPSGPEGFFLSEEKGTKISSHIYWADSKGPWLRGFALDIPRGR